MLLKVLTPLSFKFRGFQQHSFKIRGFHGTHRTHANYGPEYGCWFSRFRGFKSCSKIEIISKKFQKIMVGQIHKTLFRSQQIICINLETLKRLAISLLNGWWFYYRNSTYGWMKVKQMMNLFICFCILDLKFFIHLSATSSYLKFCKTFKLPLVEINTLTDFLLIPFILLIP